MKSVIKRRPYMSIGIGVFKQVPATGQLEFIKATTLSNKRQTLVDIELEPGRYFLVPRTSGVGFQKPLDAQREGKISIFKKNGDLTDLVELTMKDVFRRLDKIHLGGSLDHKDINKFLA